MSSEVTPIQALRGLLRPMSLQFALDPFAIKAFSKASPLRLAWTIENRLLELLAHRSASAKLPLEAECIAHLRSDRGEARDDTSVTSTQLELLLAAQQVASECNPNIAEIGSYRAATTLEFARNTLGNVYAVDPFSGYGGSEDDFGRFQERTADVANILHLRRTSGGAAVEFAEGSLGMVFIDGVHDFSNSWFDFCVWSGKVAPGGLVAFHDVDDHAGVRLAVRNLFRLSDRFQVWAYCPNLIILRKISEATRVSGLGGMRPRATAKRRSRATSRRPNFRNFDISS